ncbi:MAG: ABC transporter permease [Clostridia bacterium]|nr:ABC transporter permease [Clostridia bacterium]
MLINVKSLLKLFGVSIVMCCAAFVCTLFLSYNMDIAGIKDSLSSDAAVTLYNALITTGKVTAAVAGGYLVITSAVLLLFYVKNYIDSHGRDLGILKALGCSNMKTALRFWVFGLSVLAGCAAGFAAAYLYLPAFYKLQNAEKLFPDIAVKFHFSLFLCLVILPSAVFSLLAIFYAWYKLKKPPLELLKNAHEIKNKRNKQSDKERSFLSELRSNTLRGKKSAVFFIAFSAFCFSAMTQMSFSMKKLASAQMAFIMITIGLVLAFVTLFLSLSSVVKEHAKTVALLEAFGYTPKERSKAVLGAYRPVSYIGFAVGTLYQYGLLKIMMSLVYADIQNIASYGFDFVALAIFLPLFVAVYELMMFAYSLKIKKTSLKKIMTE